MQPIQLVEDVQPVYTTVKYKGKDRVMRRFGAVTLTDKYGKTREVRPAEYLYEYRDGKNILHYSKTPFRSTGNKEKKNETQK